MHSYYDEVLGFPFVIGLTEKLYKISYALSVGGPKCWRYPFYKEKSPIRGYMILFIPQLRHSLKKMKSLTELLNAVLPQLSHLPLILLSIPKTQKVIKNKG